MVVRHNLKKINRVCWSDTTRKSRQEEPQLHSALHLRHFVCSSATDNKFPSKPYLLLLLDGAHLVDVHGGAGPAQAPELGDHGAGGGGGGGGHQAHNCEAGPWSGQPLVEAPMGGTTVTRSSRLCRHLLPAATPSSEKNHRDIKVNIPQLGHPERVVSFLERALISYQSLHSSGQA